MKISSNTAAWQPKPGSPLEVKPAPYTSPSENEIVIKNAAVAVNPIDWKLQDEALFDWLQYPLILGDDVAGEVVEVGSGVSRFKPGDRVLIGDPEACYEVVDKCIGNKFVSTTLPIPENKPSTVNAKQIFGSTLKDNEVSQAVYVDFLAKALAEGSYVAAPEPWVIGKGLESIQAGLEA
ncbi:alcohol dehydrogenase catalytic domain-containing protein [Pleurocapsa sp. FMAR1]|uniref:alcohol dehydrogenase catalytic domain-containing protein n=1 Tax=Pleurocapsa sp. FMAR1 TaxID=3040204 RepID=UPI0029C71CF5|nr:alcohol dehydrogenase catalytic domain-containing protein [Pleurocapsa sp. FMAR1]